MCMDKLGRPWAKIDGVEAGTVLWADGGFTCIDPGAKLEVAADEKGRLFVPCSEGRHLLDGQREDGFYLGFHSAPRPKPEA